MAKLAKMKIRTLQLFVENDNLITKDIIKNCDIKTVRFYIYKLRQSGIRIKAIRRRGQQIDYRLETPHDEIDFTTAHLKRCYSCGDPDIHAKGLCSVCYYKGRKQDKDERELQAEAKEKVRYIQPYYEPKHLQHMTGERFEQAVKRIIDGMHR